MKAVIDPEFLKRLLSSGAKDLGMELSDAQLDSFILYLAELKKWNRKINLTAVRDDRDIVIKHFLDSLAYRKGFIPTPGMALLDMGSGAGFPALPLKIAYPEITVTMVESVKKKASFLRHIIMMLKIQRAEVIDRRTGELADSFEAAFDVVTARAFSDMKSALTEGRRFLKPGGLMVLSRGPDESIGEQEVEEAGVGLEKKIDFVLPHSDYKRAIWAFRKPVQAARLSNVPRGT